MIMDPPKLATLLTSLKDYTKGAATLALVRDGTPCAVIVDIDAGGGVRFLACADNFTRVIAEAHDRGRKVAALIEGGEHGDQVAAKPDQAQSQDSTHATKRAADSAISLAARIVSTVAALRVYVGPDIPAIATQLMKEIDEAATEIEVTNGLNGLALTGVANWMAAVAAMPDLVGKTADARQALESLDIEKAKDYLTGVENAIATLEAAIYP